ncbi:MAG: hypothetical protein ACTSW3_06160 [Promethearchaeota archaeon]
MVTIKELKKKEEEKWLGLMILIKKRKELEKFRKQQKDKNKIKIFGTKENFKNQKKISIRMLKNMLRDIKKEKWVEK